MLVDPEILRAFASQVDIAAADIGAADVGGKTSSAGDADRKRRSPMATPPERNVMTMETAVPNGRGKAATTSIQIPVI